MSLENVPMMRLFSAVAFVLGSALAAGADAADRSLTGTVQDAFETVVIDAAAAASKAADAAKGALATDTRKSKRTKAAAEKAEKDAKTEGAKEAQGKADTEAPDATVDEPGKRADDKAHSEKKGAPGKLKGTAGTDEKKAGPGATDGKDEPAESAAEAAEDGKPSEADTGKPADAAAKKPAIPTEWPKVDVELARARCTQLLKGVDAVSVPEAPFRKGDCGAMAPVRLISIGKNPEVSFSPPPVVTCDLVVGLTKWIKDEVQPAARRHLGSEVIRIESMSDYSCRMAYGRVGNKLSEHGKANALDIRGFITRKGEQAVVLGHWGQTKRDVAKQIAAAKAAAAQAEAARAAAEQANTERAEVATQTAKAANTDTKLPRKTLVEGVPPKKDLALPAAVTREGPVDATPASLSGADAKKLGRKDRKDTDSKGKRKKPDTVAALPPSDGAIDAVAPPPNTPTSRFLHEVHAAGCRIFGTTLGPEANEAHRNHFHVDMAERKVRKICD